MSEYRAYYLNEKDHFVGVSVLNCPDDPAAIAEAKKLLDGRDIELWQLNRMVARLSRETK